MAKKSANDPVASYRAASSYVVRELMTILRARCSENLHCALHNFPGRGNKQSSVRETVTGSPRATCEKETSDSRAQLL